MPMRTVGFRWFGDNFPIGFGNSEEIGIVAHRPISGPCADCSEASRKMLLDLLLRSGQAQSGDGVGNRFFDSLRDRRYRRNDDN